MWKCPECDRTFHTKNQWHSCAKTSLEDLFLNKPKHLRLMYENLFAACSQFCELSIDTTKSCVYFVDGQRFLVIKPQKSGLILEFVLNETIDVFPVIKIYDLGKGRIVHRLKLDVLEDINAQIVSWLKQALLIVKRN
jgi:hypothetical protein